MKKFISKLAFFLLCSQFVITSSFSEPPNLMLLKNAVKNYHDSGMYEKELAEKIKKAELFLLEQVELNSKKIKPQKLALVLDVDETSLSNYQHMALHDFAATHEQIHDDIMTANAPAIEPTLALYKTALSHGVTVFFITGRSKDEGEATQKNLINAGYKSWEHVYLRPDNYEQKSIIPFKSHTRELITQKGYIIIATIGDQNSDLKGGYALQGFKLPNPYYYLP